MKLPTVSSIFKIVAIASLAAASVVINITKGQGLSKVSSGLVSSRAITESLVNNVVQYYAQVNVGTPSQVQTLVIDTGSSDVWLLASTADLCADAIALQNEHDVAACVSTFDSNGSTSFKVVKAGTFDISYADGSGSYGDYVTDNVEIGGATIKTLQMGLGYNVSVTSGIMGIGYDSNEASAHFSPVYVYPSIIDQMVSQGLIQIKAYSLYLDDYESSSGSIIFGGLDSDKYHGQLLQLPVVPTVLKGKAAYTQLAVGMTGFSITDQDGNTQSLTTPDYDLTVVLDSGTTFTYLPVNLLGLIYKQVNAKGDGSGNYFVECSLLSTSPQMTFNFGFGGSNGITIAVPIKELVFNPKPYYKAGHHTKVPGLNDPCLLGLMPADGVYLLGDSFLRSAYVVYDLTNNLIALGQTNFDSTTSNMVEFEKGVSSIPKVAGVGTSTSSTSMSVSTKVFASTATHTSTSTTTTGKLTATTTSTSHQSTITTGTLTPTTTSTRRQSSSTAGTIASPTSPSTGSRALPALVVVGLFLLGGTFILA